MWSSWVRGSGGERRPEAESPRDGRGGAERRRDTSGDAESIDKLWGRAGQEKPKPPAEKKVSDLFTPIANLLTDLRTMHDDM